MPITYSAAPDVERIAERLIKNELEFRHLRKIRIEYLFRSEAARSNGKLTLGKARKVTGMNALMATPDLAHDPEGSSEHATFFAMEIAADMWEVMNFRQREALVYHEMCHFQVDVDEEGNPSLSIRPHDVEVFAAEVNKYGPWKMDLYQFFYDVGAHDVISIFNQGAPPEHFGRPEGVSEDGEVVEGPWAASQSSEPEQPFT